MSKDILEIIYRYILSIFMPNAFDQWLNHYLSWELRSSLLTSDIKIQAELLMKLKYMLLKLYLIDIHLELPDRNLSILNLSWSSKTYIFYIKNNQHMLKISIICSKLCLYYFFKKTSNFSYLIWLLSKQYYIRKDDT